MIKVINNNNNNLAMYNGLNESTDLSKLIKDKNKDKLTKYLVSLGDGAEVTQPGDSSVVYHKASNGVKSGWSENHNGKRVNVVLWKDAEVARFLLDSTLTKSKVNKFNESTMNESKIYVVMDSGDPESGMRDSDLEVVCRFKAKDDKDANDQLIKYCKDHYPSRRRLPYRVVEDKKYKGKADKDLKTAMYNAQFEGMNESLKWTPAKDYQDSLVDIRNKIESSSKKFSFLKDNKDYKDLMAYLNKAIYSLGNLIENLNESVMDESKSSISNGQLTYTGFDNKDNGKFIIEEGTGMNKGWTYVNYQKDEFTQVIAGYVKVKGNEFTADFGPMDDHPKKFKNKDDAIKYIINAYKKKYKINESLEDGDNQNINESFDDKVFSKLKKSKDVPKGENPNDWITDGRGNMYKIPKDGYSPEIKKGAFLFRYNYKDRTVEVIDPENRKEVLDHEPLSVGDWFDGPEYWIDEYYKDLEEEISKMRF